MVNQQLLDYIKQCLQQNFSQEQIRAELKKAGWQEADVNEAFKALPTAKPAAVSAMNPQPAVQTTEPKVGAIHNFGVRKELGKESGKEAKEETEKEAKPRRFPKLKSKKIAIVASLVAGLLLVGGGALAYHYYFPSPEKVLKKMLENLDTIHSLSYATEIKVDYRVGQALENNPFYSGLTGSTDPATGSATNTALNSTSTAKLHQLTLGISGQTDFQSNLKNLLAFKINADQIASGTTLGVEIRNIDQMVYLNFDLPNLGFVDPSALKNQWLKFDASSSLNNLAREKTAQTPGATASSTRLNWQNKIVTLKTTLIESGTFKLSGTLASEKINNIDTYHYGFTLDKAGLEKFILAASKSWTGKDLTEQEIASMKSDLNKLDLSAGEIWIGKKDYLPYKIILNVALKSQASDNIKVEKISFSFAAQNFNQPLTVKAPDSSKFFEELMREFSESVLGGNSMVSTSTNAMPDSSATSTPEEINNGTSSPAVDEQLDSDSDSDSDGLTDYEETNVYHTDPYNSDTDGDSYLDGVEVQGGYDPNGSGKLPTAGN